MPALHVREPNHVKGQVKIKGQGKAKGRQIVKGEEKSEISEQEMENDKTIVKSHSKVKEPNYDKRVAKSHGKMKAKNNDNEPNDEFGIPVRIKEEPVDDFEQSVNLGHSAAGKTGKGGDEVPIDHYDNQDLYQAVEKTDEEDYSMDNSSGIFGNIEHVGSVLDGSKSYAGNWTKNTMNKNKEYVCEGQISKNVYTVLPYKPTETEIYSKKKRGRPLNPYTCVPTTDDYLNNEDNPLNFDFDPNNGTIDEIPPHEQEILDTVTKDLTAELATQVTNKRNSKGKLKVKLKEKDSKTEKKKERKPSKPPKVEDGSELSGYGNTFLQVKQEKVDDDDEYKQNNAGIQADSEIPEPDSDSGSEEESVGRRRSKRRRTSRQIKKPDYDYDYDDDTDEMASTSKSMSAGIQVQNENDDDEFSDSAGKMDLLPGKTKTQNNKDAIINPVLLKGSRYVGTICQKISKTPKPKDVSKDSKKVLKNYLDSIGLDVGGFNESESEPEDSDQEQLEIDGGVKVIQPNVSLPKGTRSRYMQPTVAQVKHRYVRKKDGELKKVASIVKTKPKIFQGHQKKPNAGPVYVMCHPTKPIVRL